MKQHWNLEGLVNHWTLTSADLESLKRLAIDTKLVVAVMLKACAVNGVFPRVPSELPSVSLPVNSACPATCCPTGVVNLRMLYSTQSTPQND
ncbi:MAG: hypothetical protein HC933_05085 [Pleurocapsa sp. SU_196_0]|nr:hypothetical protein [Pleurocapsa sp. SU_196_0]